LLKEFGYRLLEAIDHRLTNGAFDPIWNIASEASQFGTPYLSLPLRQNLAPALPRLNALPSAYCQGSVLRFCDAGFAGGEACPFRID